MDTLVLVLVALALVGCVRNGDLARPDEDDQDAPVPTVAAIPLDPTEHLDLRRWMVEKQIVARGVHAPRVIDAMVAVPRHHFVPGASIADAYGDGAYPIDAGQTISQPYIVAFMTEALDLQPGEKVLEIGTGSGYQAAVLAEITPRVFTIEIIEELGREAREVLDRLGYDQVVSRIGDGYAGWPDEAPFDAIIVTAAPDHVPPALLAQLAPGGRLCLPVGDTWGDQELLLITKGEDGTLDQRTIAPVRFVPMTGIAEER